MKYCAYASLGSPSGNVWSKSVSVISSFLLLRLAVDVGHVLGVVAVPAHADAPGEAVEVGALVGGQRNLGRGRVLPDAFRAAGPGDRHDPRLLGEQPCQGDLPGRR